MSLPSEPRLSCLKKRGSSHVKRMKILFTECFTCLFNLPSGRQSSVLKWGSEVSIVEKGAPWRCLEKASVHLQEIRLPRAASYVTRRANRVLLAHQLAEHAPLTGLARCVAAAM
ncbi:hypothetical protein AVEN_191148-1 [Araneus ventricosus]|uniref:Uncharacterized protein n=1 Tax=Araneus ventricosus TaxID=182803 RepID=A0A4Y2AXV7_ARAVE|nr:hypothetical protein AVEN_191148-1 [Araneus ventricosus]